jgi:hypothetical protein
VVTRQYCGELGCLWQLTNQLHVDCRCVKLSPRSVVGRVEAIVDDDSGVPKLSQRDSSVVHGRITSEYEVKVVHIKIYRL